MVCWKVMSSLELVYSLWGRRKGKSTSLVVTKSPAITGVVKNLLPNLHMTVDEYSCVCWSEPI